MKLTVAVTILALLVSACRNDNNAQTPDSGGGTVDTGSDSGGGGLDGGGGDHEDDAGVPDLGDDAGNSGCLQVTAAQAFNANADDVSIEYWTNLMPNIEGETRELSFLFERYNDTEYVGTFELGTGADANFGTCAHCLFIRGDVPERAFFADRGTLVSNSDPYSRRLDVAVTNLRLIEVTVEPLTRESTPVENGVCIEVADFAKTGVFPPAAWTCAPQNYANGVSCDCECGEYDPDCGVHIPHCLPGEPGCPEPVDPLPVVGCQAEEVCTFDPIGGGTTCAESCDWLGRQACDAGTCVFDFGVGDGDLCMSDPARVAAGVTFGQECPRNGLQVLCNIVDGFALGYCSPNDVCSPVCQSNDECTTAGETCRFFVTDGPLGYCGPEPTDG